MVEHLHVVIGKLLHVPWLGLLSTISESELGPRVHNPFKCICFPCVKIKIATGRHSLVSPTGAFPLDRLFGFGLVAAQLSVPEVCLEPRCARCSDKCFLHGVLNFHPAQKFLLLQSSESNKLNLRINVGEDAGFLTGLVIICSGSAKRQNWGHMKGGKKTRIHVCTIASVVCVHAVWLFFCLFQKSAAASLCAQPLFAPTTVRADGSIYLRLCV